jgi:hypothetical protein
MKNYEKCKECSSKSKNTPQVNYLWVDIEIEIEYSKSKTKFEFECVYRPQPVTVLHRFKALLLLMNNKTVTNYSSYFFT